MFCMQNVGKSLFLKYICQVSVVNSNTYLEIRGLPDYRQLRQLEH
jgi:hypothetical protein